MGKQYVAGNGLADDSGRANDYMVRVDFKFLGDGLGCEGGGLVAFRSGASVGKAYIANGGLHFFCGDFFHRVFYAFGLDLVGGKKARRVAKLLAVDKRGVKSFAARF